MARSRPSVPGAPINVRTDRGSGASGTAARAGTREGSSQSTVIPASLRGGSKEAKAKIDALTVRAIAAKEAIRKKKRRGSTWEMFRQGNAATIGCGGSPEPDESGS